MTPINIAAYEGHADIVRLLLDGGADPNIQDFVRMSEGGSDWGMG
jgi:ankyrin repeat protein